MSKEWYASWFDSPYYHLLYRQRDDKEAADFLNRLLSRLNLAKGSRVLDLACGKGRHARHLFSCGYDVTGTDLSTSNINACLEHEQDGLRFFRHDMRNLLVTCYFDAVFNLFTSFGYFRSAHENQRAVLAAAAALKPGGYLILDYLNVKYAVDHLVAEETLEIEKVKFQIRRFVENQKIVKEITINDRGTTHVFKEEVSALKPADFEDYFRKAHLTLEETFGDYRLSPYSDSKSSRLIFIAVKKPDRC